MTPFIHEFSVDLRRGSAIQRGRRTLSQGDALADQIVVRISDGGKQIDLTGIGVSAKVIRGDGRTVPVVGTTEGNAAIVVLDADCYAVPGEIRVSVAISVGETVQTVLVLLLNVDTSETDIVVDNGEIGDLSALLGAIAELRSATEDARAVLDALPTDGLVAPAIIDVETGTVAETGCALAYPAKSVVTHIAPEQDGDPSPDNVAPLATRTSVTLWVDNGGDGAVEYDQVVPEMYGGDFDWVTGVLKVTHKLVTLDGTASWQVGTNNIFVRLNDIAQGARLYSNQFVDAPTMPVASMAEGQMRQGAEYRNVVFANPKNAYTLDAWKARANSQPIQLAYPVTSATEVQLDAHQVDLAAGWNAVWSDAGQTSLHFASDTKGYIDKVIAAMVATVPMAVDADEAEVL